MRLRQLVFCMVTIDKWLEDKLLHIIILSILLGPSVRMECSTEVSIVALFQLHNRGVVDTTPNM